MKNSGRWNQSTSLLSVLLLLLFTCSALLSSCSAENDVGKTGNTDTTQAAAGETATDDSTLLYYVALVGRLEEEILQLKEEIFLLQYGESTSVDLPTTDTSVSLPTEASDYTYRVIDGYAVITAYCGRGGDVVLPASLGGCPVKVIGDSAFANSPVTSVVLPDSVTKIDWFAFRDCLSLTAIVGGDAICEIGYGAFDGCPASLVVICPKGSYLAAYAGSFGIAVRNR